MSVCFLSFIGEIEEVKHLTYITMNSSNTYLAFRKILQKM